MKWKSVRLKYVARFQYGDALPKENELEGDIFVFGSNGPYSRHHLANTQAPVIIIGRKGSYGKINWSPNPCFASDTTFFIDENSTKQNLRWLYYVLQSLNLHVGSDEAAVPGLNREDAYEKVVCLLPITEQQAIADMLDRETSRLDELIAEKEHLLELLDEKRRTLITYAVTRGLNHDALLRDSGLQWLGEIPAHWKTMHLKRVLISLDYGISESVNHEGNIAVLRMGDIHDGEILFDNIGFVGEVEQRLLLKPGDLVFNRTNSLDQIGKVGLFRGFSEYPVTFASYLVRLRCSEKIIPTFLNYLLNSSLVLAWAKSEALPAIGQVNLNPNRYGFLPIALPPIEEQHAIVDYIESETKKLDEMRDVTTYTIGLLKERRVALIAAAVTGQISI